MKSFKNALVGYYKVSIWQFLRLKGKVQAHVKEYMKVLLEQKRLSSVTVTEVRPVRRSQS